MSYNPGSYGRECRAAFRCEAQLDPSGNACRCSRSVGRDACTSCDYGVDGATCTRCTNGMVLSAGACADHCPPGETAVSDEVALTGGGSILAQQCEPL